MNPNRKPDVRMAPALPLSIADSHEPEREIAAAVIKQAFEDLTSKSKLDREDAYDFLTVRLWEPDNHWGQCARLNKEKILKAVEDVCGKK